MPEDSIWKSKGGGGYSWESGILEVASSVVAESLSIEGGLEVLKSQGNVKDIGIGESLGDVADHHAGAASGLSLLGGGSLLGGRSLLSTIVLGLGGGLGLVGVLTSGDLNWRCADAGGGGHNGGEGEGVLHDGKRETVKLFLTVVAS